MGLSSPVNQAFGYLTELHHCLSLGLQLEDDGIFQPPKSSEPILLRAEDEMRSSGSAERWRWRIVGGANSGSHHKGLDGVLGTVMAPLGMSFSMLMCCKRYNETQGPLEVKSSMLDLSWF